MIRYDSSITEKWNEFQSVSLSGRFRDAGSFSLWRKEQLFAKKLKLWYVSDSVTEEYIAKA